MKLRAGQVEVGDRFTKTGFHPRIVYVVGAIVASYGHPQHVRLLAEGQNDSMLISVSALTDDEFWLRVA
ncbi:MAG TPA: hypothetical protein VM689_25540 [Aliidongia sp.]|nr:hypothetical protein [Aliidongia sp.]